jgi:hypothetical protein
MAPFSTARISSVQCALNSETLSRLWTYRATEAYGGPKVDEGELFVNKAEVLPGGKAVCLAIDGLKQGYVLRLRCNPVAASGRAIWSGEVWYTLNRLP